MAYTDVNPLSKQVTIVTGLFVVGMMAFGLALSYYKNILFDRQLSEMRQQNDSLAGDITAGYGELEYLQSAQYKDKYAKENLNRVNPGEKVLLLATEHTPVLFDTSEDDAKSAQKEAVFEQTLRTVPVIQQWNWFLFQKQKIEELKKSL